MIPAVGKSPAIVTRLRYSTVAVLLHWSIAALLVLQLCLGWRIEDASHADRSVVLQLHKTIGIAILLLTGVRLGWRLLRPPPTGDLSPVERWLSAWVHRAFYVLLLCLPLSGWAMVSFGGGGVKLLGGLRWPQLPLRTWLPTGVREAVATQLGGLHEVLAWSLVALVALHVAGALRHQLGRRDDVLSRMATWVRPDRAWSPGILAVPLAATIIGIAAFLVRGMAPLPLDRSRPASAGEATVYRDVIAPLLARRCGACHDDDWSWGGLSLASHASMMAGGIHGASISLGDPGQSELVRRVSLPANDRQFMPPEGKTPLTADQVEILKWWIREGAPRDAEVSALQPPADVESALARVLRLEAGGGESGSGALPEVPPADARTVAALERAGFVVRAAAYGSNLLDVSRFTQQAISDQDVAALSQLREQIRTLSLPDSGLTDAGLQRLVPAPQLVRLRVSGNPVTDRGLVALSAAPVLESLNLYDTGVTDAGLATAASLPALKRLYVHRTSASKSGVARLRASRPDLVVDLEASDAPRPASTAVPGER